MGRITNYDKKVWNTYKQALTPKLSVTKGTGVASVVVSNGLKSFVNGDLITIGDTYTVTATPSSGYAHSALLINGVVKANPATVTITDNQFSVVAQASDILFDLAVVGNHMTLSVVDGDIEYSAGANVLPLGAEVVITATNDVGYEVTGITVNGVAFTNGDTLVVSTNTEIEVFVAELSHDLAITKDANCTLTVMYGEDELVAGEDAIPNSAELVITATADSGYSIATLTINGTAFTSGESIVATEDIAILVTAVALAQPFTIPGDYTLSDYNYEDEAFKDSIYEAEHMDILDQWYTLNYTYDALGGGTPTDVVVKGTLDADMGIGAMDMIMHPTGEMVDLGDAGFAIMNAVIVPGDGTPGGGNFSMTPSEDVTTLIIDNQLSGIEGGPSPAIGKIVSINSLTATSMQDLIINATGCTVEVQSSNHSDVLFASGTGTLPTGYEIQFVVTPNEGFTAQGMTFEVNGVAFDPLSDIVIVPAGAVTITATAVALDLPLVGEIDFNTNSTWDSERLVHIVDTVHELDFSSVADGDVNLKITVTLDGTPMTIKGTKYNVAGNIMSIRDLFEGNHISIASGIYINVTEELGASPEDFICLVAPENYLLTHTVVLNSIEIDENIEEILNADISYVYDSVDTFDGTITAQTLDVSGLTNEQDNIYTYWDIDGTKYLVQAMSIINGTTTSLQENALLDSISITLNVNAKIIDTDGTLTTEITGSALTGNEVITLLAVFIQN